MTTKTVLEVGNCDADHSRIKQMLESNFEVSVVRAHNLDDASKALAEKEVDLIMINRLLDVDSSEGMEVFRQLSSLQSSKVPTMLITNFEEHQQAAVAEGAIRGFGKAAINSEETLAAIGEALAAA